MKEMNVIYHYESPIGGMTMAGGKEGLTGLWFDGQKYFAAGLELKEETEEKRLPVFAKTVQWLDFYFAGKEPDFMPPLCIRTTPFRRRVWELLQEIPYGKTTTYGEIAAKIAAEQGKMRMCAQAVGGAVSRNVFSILIPCHRVIGSDGSLTGYAGGIERKKYLLTLERSR